METKEHIMNVGMRLFSEKGFESTTVRDIASKANINIALISYHFGSKEGLLKNIFQQRALNLQFHIWEIAKDETLNELQKIHAIVEHYTEKIFTNHEFHKVILRELFASNREDVHADTISIFSENSKIVISIIEEGINKKIFRKADPELCFASIVGTMNHLVHSTMLRKKIFGSINKKDPITEETFKKRVTKHIQQMIEHHLIADNNNK